MSDKFCMTVRKLTVAPLMAAVFLCCMLIHRFDVFGNVFRWLYFLLFIGVFPLLAYPLQKFFPKFRDAGRQGQRTLAMIFAVSGYILGCLFNMIFSSTKGGWVIFLQYLLSGILIFLFNKAFKMKISGHACGIVGPLMLLLYFGLYIQAAVGVLLTVLVYIVSLKTKRHTLPQLIGGSIAPVLVTVILFLIFGAYV